jgi:hypothetical protein
MDNNLLIYILFALNALCFLIGYLFGKFFLRTNPIISQGYKNQKFGTGLGNTIMIDDKKVVVDIDTKGLEKKYNSLGDIKTTQENISDSVNKLKNLKR